MSTYYGAGPILQGHTCMNSFIPHDNPGVQEKGGTEKFSNLSKFLRFVCSGAGIRSQAVSTTRSWYLQARLSAGACCVTCSNLHS